MARRRLPLSDSAKPQILEQLRSARFTCVDVIRTVPIGGEEAKAADRVLTAIDDFAGVLTGNREYFWNQPAGTRLPQRDS